jgi:carboxyl-terminal processing protease
VSNVTFKDMGDGVMYIKIARFGDYQTFLDFVTRYKKLPYEGYRSVVIDVRGNPGGDLAVLYNMLNYVVPDKNVSMFALRYRDMKVQELKSTGIGWRPNKIVVLADGGSASASEIFAGSLQDLGYADIVGQTTYGKGYGQLHINLGDDSTAVISNFEIWLPVTIKYDGKGIKPKYSVPLGQEPYPIPRLTPLYQTGSITLSEAYSDRAYALEQRLSLLGYLGKTPNGVYDSETSWAVSAFNLTHNIPETGGCSNATIAAVNADIDALSKTTVTVDSQFDKALELAREAAKKPLSYELPVIDLD